MCRTERGVPRILVSWLLQDLVNGRRVRGQTPPARFLPGWPVN